MQHKLNGMDGTKTFVFLSLSANFKKNSGTIADGVLFFFWANIKKISVNNFKWIPNDEHILGISQMETKIDIQCDSNYRYGK